MVIQDLHSSHCQFLSKFFFKVYGYTTMFIFFLPIFYKGRQLLRLPVSISEGNMTRKPIFYKEGKKGHPETTCSCSQKKIRVSVVLKSVKSYTFFHHRT